MLRTLATSLFSTVRWSSRNPGVTALGFRRIPRCYQETGQLYVHTAGDLNNGENKPLQIKARTKEDDLGSFSYSQFLDHFYELLCEGQDRMLVSRLLRGIKNSGLWKNDPRLQETMQKINDLYSGSADVVDVLLDKEGLQNCIQDNIVVIRRAFVGDLVIPEFSQFCNMIDEIYWACRSNTGGKVSSYIPQLSSYSPDYWGISLCTVDGQRHSIGDVEAPFTVQSSGKPINYALAVHELGADVVHQYVGHEPSGETFDSMRLNKVGKPHNPMNNDGALVVTSLLYNNMSLADRFDSILAQYRRLSGGEFVSFNNSTFLTEREVADRNYALGYYLRENKCFPDGINLHETMDLYFQLCSVEINVNSGAVIAASLANGGYCPLTEEQVLSSTSVRNSLSLMHSCGMYEYSADLHSQLGCLEKLASRGGILLVIRMSLGCAFGLLDWMTLETVSVDCSSVNNLSRLSISTTTAACSVQEPSSIHAPRRTDMQSNQIVKLLFSAGNGDLTGLIRMAMANQDMALADYDGRTALHVASSEGHLECVKFLVEKCQVPMEAKDRWGQTALDDAIRFGHGAVESYLTSIKDNC